MKPKMDVKDPEISNSERWNSEEDKECHHRVKSLGDGEGVVP